MNKIKTFLKNHDFGTILMTIFLVLMGLGVVHILLKCTMVLLYVLFKYPSVFLIGSMFILILVSIYSNLNDNGK